MSDMCHCCAWARGNNSDQDPIPARGVVRTQIHTNSVLGTDAVFPQEIVGNSAALV